MAMAFAIGLLALGFGNPTAEDLEMLLDPGFERRFHVRALSGGIRTERNDRAAVHLFSAMAHTEVERDHRAKRILGFCRSRGRPSVGGALHRPPGRLRSQVLL